MGEHRVNSKRSTDEHSRFLSLLLNDLKALDFMLSNKMFETGVQRIGAEQEFCLVDQNFKPSLKGPKILQSIDHPQFTTELARFNLEINLNPFRFRNNCFSKLESELRELLDLAHNEAHKQDAKVILTGILPTISLAELSLEYMTPNPRYAMLGDIMREIRGSDFELHIQGIDDLIIRHDNILFEACNTSFQIHLQVDPDDFVDRYNWAQAISGPILSLCSNSPLLFGKELWSETRIALFEQSIDTRDIDSGIRERQARVYFGKEWVRNSVLDIYKDDISRFPLLLSTDVPDSLEELNRGEIPRLKALSMHNGTIWKWNRPCYGVGGDKPHLRIENRYIPSGPSIDDEIANTALWIGVMNGMPEDYRNIWEKLEFEEARENFHKAAKSGMEVVLSWNGELHSSTDFATDFLIPIARKGLLKAKVDEKEVDHYLGIIERRVAKKESPSRWMIRNYRNLKKHEAKEDVLNSLTAGIYERFTSNRAISEWDDIVPGMSKSYHSDNRIDQVMSTELFTVQEDDLIELVEHIMRWRNINHIPVEDAHGKLKGLISNKVIEKFKSSSNNELRHVRDFMTVSLISVDPSTSIKEAMDLMLREKIGCLPVLKNDKLIGLVTETDMKRIWSKLKS